MTTELQPWYWREQHLENRTGSDIFAALFLPTSGSSIATLLESPYPTPTNHPQLARYSICAGAPRTVGGHLQMWTPPLGQVLPFLELLQQRKQPDAPTFRRGETHHTPAHHLPFTGGWLGWLGYDIAWEIEVLPHKNFDPLPFPVAFWYEPECFAILDHADQVLWLAASDTSGLDELEKRLETEKVPSLPHSHARRFSLPRRCANKSGNPTAGATTLGTKATHCLPNALAPHFCTSQQDYEAAVNRAKKYIQAGDIFQTNLSLRFQALSRASGWEIYLALQKINPSPFASYWQTPWGEVISCSPERLVQLNSKQAQTRPIAGTRSRGATPEQDEQLAIELLNNTKERAEHIMLVDLERNDLGRVCEWGSVKVDELLTIERYSHVMHLVSNVKGTLGCECLRHGEAERTAIDLIRAMFPGGTITGCPKVRCMEIIEELEPVRRNLFYGSCGYLDWRGNLDLNILIRTLLLTPFKEGGKGTIQNYSHSPTSPINTVWGQVGAGIVADSDPQREWYESLHKAQAQLKALENVLNQDSIR